jgi:hypothetical protein
VLIQGDIERNWYRKNHLNDYTVCDVILFEISWKYNHKKATENTNTVLVSVGLLHLPFSVQGFN